MSVARAVRRVALCALTVALGVTVAGCTQAPLDVVPGENRDPGTTSPSSGTDGTSGHSGELGGPLVAADLAGWVDRDVPESATVTLVQPCGQPTGVRDVQEDVRTAALTTPTGITVVNQVATYGSVNPALVLSDSLSRELLSCPAYTDGDVEVFVTTASAADTSPVVGVQVVRVAPVTGLRDVTAYWADLAGPAGTVEVAVSAQLGAAGDAGLLEFAWDVLVAAKAKALGQPVPTVQAPQLPEVLTQEQVEQRRQEQLDAAVQDPSGGITDGPGAVLGEEDAREREVTDPGSVYTDPPVVEHDIAGETGPGVIEGTVPLTD